MKNSLSLLFVLLFFTYATRVTAQQRSCCSAATTEFAMLGSDAAFQAAHLAPEPINFQASKGADITFPVKGGKEGRGFLVKATNASIKYLFVFHEWWGLND